MASSDYLVGELMHGDPIEVGTVFAFFEKHWGKEVEVTISLFQGFLQRERMRVAYISKTGPSNHRIRLISLNSSREIEVLLDQFAFASITPDQKTIEIQHLLSGNLTFSLTASEVR